MGPGSRYLGSPVDTPSGRPTNTKIAFDNGDIRTVKPDGTGS